MKNKVIYCLLAIIMIATIILSGCAKETSTTTNTSAASSDAVAVSEWHIPFLIPLSGALAGRLEPNKWLVDRVASEINAAGGIMGKPVVIDYYDTALDPTKTVAAMGKAIDANSLCIIGPVVDQEVQAAMPLAVKAGMFCFSATGSEKNAQTFAPWELQATVRYEDESKYLPEIWVKQQPSIKSVAALVLPIYPLEVTMWEETAKNLQTLGVNTYPMIEVSYGLLDYSPLAIRAINTGANAFYISATEDIAAKIIKELYARGVDMKNVFLTGESVSTSAFLKQSEGCNEGVFSTTSPDYEPTAKFAAYNKAYKESHNDIGLNSMAFCHADMLLMIKNAIEATKVTGDPTKVKEERIKIKDYAYNQKGFNGIYYPKYDVINGIAYHLPQRLFQVQKGQLVLIKEVIPD